jgi:hypothetical protein
MLLIIVFTNTQSLYHPHTIVFFHFFTIFVCLFVFDLSDGESLLVLNSFGVYDTASNTYNSNATDI